MPPPLKLIGRRFGKLLVIAKTDKAVKGGSWICRCDCGREEEIRSHNLPYAPYIEKCRSTRTACTVCTYTRSCDICGTQFVALNSNTTCSPECLRKKRQRIDLACYHRKAAANPKLNQERNLKAKARREADPIKMAHYRAREKKGAEARMKRKQEDPAYRERENAVARARYAREAEERQARRRAIRIAKLAAMTTDERAIYDEKQRLYWAHYAQARRQLIKSDPDTYAKYLDYMRAQRRKSTLKAKAKAAEADFMRAANELLKRQEKK